MATPVAVEPADVDTALGDLQTHLNLSLIHI